MKYLLDTNICIYIINSRPESVLERFKSMDIGDIAISAITLYELQYGAYKSGYPEKNLAALRKFVLPLDILNFNAHIADTCGRIRAEQEKGGQIVGAMDLQIAATAISHNLILVTNNTKEFERILELKLENWI